MARIAPTDRFFLTLDRVLRKAGTAGFQAVLAVDLHGTLDPVRLHESWTELLDAFPQGRCRLGRWLGVGPYCWKGAPRSSADSFRREPEGAEENAEDAALRALNEPLDPAREPLVDVRVRRLGTDHWRVTLRWNHALMDEKGAELTLQELSRRYLREGEAPRAPARIGPELPTTLRSRREGLLAARGLLGELTEASPTALPAPTSPPARTGWRIQRSMLGAAEDEQLRQHLTTHYGAANEALGQIGLSLHALATVAPETPVLATPISVQLRPTRARAPLFSNELSFLFHALPREVLADEAALGRHLQEAARQKVLGGEVENSMLMLQIGRWLPLWAYQREQDHASGGPRFSLFVSTVGDLLGGADRLMGCEVRDGIALTAFPPPCLGVIFSRSGGRQSITTVHSPAHVDSAAAAHFHQTLRAKIEHP